MINGLNHRRFGAWLAVPGLLSLVFLFIVAFFNWMLALSGVILLTASAFWLVYGERRLDEEMTRYISGLSYRLKQAGDEALLQMPIGIILYNEVHQIEWNNPYLNAIAGDRETWIGKSLKDVSEALAGLIKSDHDESLIEIGEKYYRVRVKKNERLVYLQDVTNQVRIRRLYEEERTVLALIFLDNYDEVTQGLEDQIRSTLNNETTALIKAWATQHHIYLRRTASDRFLAVLNERTLKRAEEGHFDLLDKVREKTVPLSHIPLTLSIGIGAGATELEDLGAYAQSALDLGLGRGGDQVVIKRPNGEVKFYGGKSNPVEKRTRVRARVISHALSELMIESDQVMIMGHTIPDLDSIGSCIGILKIAQANGRNAKIILDRDNSPDIGRLLSEIDRDRNLRGQFITAEEAKERVSRKTLVVVTDTHRPTLVAAPGLLNLPVRVVVIDHHRRAEESISNPVLIYMEPYASSACELVTELLEYQQNKHPLEVIEATALLGGIAVDTKNFTLRTGFRTFDAASYLRAHGADTILVQKFLSDTLSQFNRRAGLIRRTNIYKDHIAFIVGEADETYEQVLIAQAADTLLTLEGIRSSFVVALRPDGQVGVSARSLGDINVQIIMESLGGGGHLTNAAVQLENVTVDEAAARVKDAIDRYLEGGLT